jgi:glycosyltransferase involved in cell wall biosynthesis
MIGSSSNGGRKSSNSPAKGTAKALGDYCLISPARNEAEYITKTLDSVLAQTVLPKRWIIIDDGSTDDTPQILADYAARHRFIEVHTRANRGTRALGGGVVEVFNQGMELLRDDPTEFVCKLDVDLILPPRYFERLLGEMARDKRLGSVSGKPYFRIDGEHPDRLKSERIGDDVSAGMTKFYRRAFLDDIGGLVKGLIWDGIDCYRGRMLGWRSKSIDHPELRFIHLRQMGSSDRGIITGRRRNGEGYWFMGAAPLFVFAKAVYGVGHKPALLGSLALLHGYARAWLKGVPRYDDLEFRRYLRRYHAAMLIYGRAGALHIFNRKADDAWKTRADEMVTRRFSGGGNSSAPAPGSDAAAQDRA